MIAARLAWLRDDPALPLERLANQLNPTQAGDYAQLRLASRQRSFLLSRALLARLLASTPGLDPARVHFARALSGRLLLAEPPGWHISLSHGDGAVAVMLAQAPCGVDIEREHPRAGLRRVAARYFAPAEQAWLASLAAASVQSDFFRLWTLKEAAAKARGEGIAHNLARLAFDLSGPRPQPRDAAQGLQVWQAPAADAWLAGVVDTATPVDWHCQEVGLATLLEA